MAPIATSCAEQQSYCDLLVGLITQITIQQDRIRGSHSLGYCLIQPQDSGH